MDWRLDGTMETDLLTDNANIIKMAMTIQVESRELVTGKDPIEKIFSADKDMCNICLFLSFQD